MSDQATQTSSLPAPLPFYLSFLLIPLVWIGAVFGGWWILIAPLATWYLFSALDLIVGQNTGNPDPQTDEAALFWYRILTQIWVPMQALSLFGLIYYVPRTDLGLWERAGVFFGAGVMSGTVGIVYAHELLHQKGRIERFLGDLLLGMVLYGHFRSEHLLVHHIHVGTPRDPVTARYNEGFHRFYPRVLWQSLRSAFRAERERLARGGLAWWHQRNPFWRYLAMQGGMLCLAFAISGASGLMLFAIQAGVAIWQLEVVNYVEHYGLTRAYLGNGKYERVLPRHSWNANQRATNWLMINLQRHSDHHYKPDRRFPLLQTYGEEEAPQLPFGYPLMALFAMIPPVWRRVMNPRVRAWRKRHYPQVTDWSAYNKATHPASGERGDKGGLQG